MQARAREFRVIKNEAKIRKVKATGGPVSKLLAGALGALVFVLAYAAGGGHIFVLNRPIELSVVALLPFLFSAHQFGFKTTLNAYSWIFLGLERGPLDEGLKYNIAAATFRSTLAATHLCGLMGLLKLLGGLTQGPEVIGYRAAMIIVSYIFGLFIAALVPSSGKEEGRAIAIGLTLLAPFFGIAVLTVIIVH